MTCPELIASMLFMEAMDDNEAITVSGYEKFSEFSGCADALIFAGDYCDKAEVSNITFFLLSLLPVVYSFSVI